jgi:NAD(P)-dependent dehydrogenase (short-subunit alcohol dehydrogenase family)
MDQIEKLGDASFVQTDISDEQSTLACAAKTKEQFGGIDILANNAALYFDIDNERNDYEYLQKVFSVNLHAPVNEFREVGAYTYSQTKWGVLGLTKFLAGQLGQYNITVNCIAPGVTMTEATRKIVPEALIGQVLCVDGGSIMPA